MRARQVNSVQIRCFACHQRGDQEIRERDLSLPPDAIVCALTPVSQTDHRVYAPGHLQLNMLKLIQSM